MSLPSLQARRRNVRPVVDGLESRELLSAAPMVAAQVSMISGQEMSQESIVGQLPNAPVKTFSTIPANGDQNPYGVAFVPRDFEPGGLLHPGDVLVSNFNNRGVPPKGNLQGTGTTIVKVSPDGKQSVFFQFQGPSLGKVGLTTALGVLKEGFVIVGSVPSTDGTPATVQQGSLIVLDRNGNVVTTLSDKTLPKLLDGPWDLTINDQGERAQVFVSNVLSGTVTRLDVSLSGGFHVVSATQIASGYIHHGDPMAFEIGPTGLVYVAKTDTLYVASTGDNAIYAIHHAGSTGADQGTGKLVYKDDTHLHGPLGLVLTPDGNLITANGDSVNPDPKHPSELVEFTPKGHFVAQFQLDPNPDGPFGIALGVTGDVEVQDHDHSGRNLTLAAVNDNQNTVELFQVNG